MSRTDCEIVNCLCFCFLDFYFITDSEIRICSSMITDQGLPILTLSNGKSFTYKVELGCWYGPFCFSTCSLIGVMCCRPCRCHRCGRPHLPAKTGCSPNHNTIGISCHCARPLRWQGVLLTPESIFLMFWSLVLPDAICVARVLLSDRNSGLHQCSDHSRSLPQIHEPKEGPLAVLQANKSR